MWFGTLIGHILAALCGKISFFYTDDLPIKVIVVKRLLPKWAIAQTWGSIVLIRQGYITPDTLKHEKIHVLQWKKYSIFFIPLYIIYTIEAAYKYGIKSGYRQNRFEKEARSE